MFIYDQLMNKELISYRIKYYPFIFSKHIKVVKKFKLAKL